MYHHIFADIIVVIHLLFILFVIFGGILVYYKKWVIWLHLPAVIWGIFIEISGWICPLTPLENYFRFRANEIEYQESFIEHYLIPIIYPQGLTRDVQIILGVLVILMNGIIYAKLIIKSKYLDDFQI